MRLDEHNVSKGPSVTIQPAMKPMQLKFSKTAKTSPTSFKFDAKSIEDMDRLIHTKAREIKASQKNYMALVQKSKGKQEVSNAKRELELVQRELLDLEDIRDEKVPMIEKLQETCEKTPYYKLQSSNM